MEWRAVPGFDGLYEVSDAGLVRSVDRWLVDSVGRRRWYSGQELVVLYGSSRSYGHVQLNGGSRSSRTRAVHRLVMLAFVGPCPPGQEVLHGNGDRTDNRLANLRYGTSSENKLDLVAHGTHPYSKRSSCKHGHRLAAPNLAPHASRGRTCLSCHRARCARSDARRAGRAVPDFRPLADAIYSALVTPVEVG